MEAALARWRRRRLHGAMRTLGEHAEHRNDLRKAVTVTFLQVGGERAGRAGGASGWRTASSNLLLEFGLTNLPTFLPSCVLLPASCVLRPAGGARLPSDVREGLPALGGGAGHAGGRGALGRHDAGTLL
jgi:hypothetical protein